MTTNPTSQSPLTPEDLDAIEARANAATHGPWYYDTYNTLLVEGDVEGHPHVICQIPDHPDGESRYEPEEITERSLWYAQSQANILFLESARTDAPRLIKALREAWAREATQEANYEAIGQDYVRVNSELQARIPELEAQGKSDTEVCICAAVKATTGVIIRCQRHADGFSALERRGLTLLRTIDGQGFITSSGRYVNRIEGRKLQEAAGIPSFDRCGYMPAGLCSEDLY